MAETEINNLVSVIFVIVIMRYVSELLLKIYYANYEITKT